MYFCKKLKKMEQALKTRILIISSIILLLSLLNIWFSQIPNFSPIAAMALFGGAYLNEKKIALLIPLAALFLSDLFIGVHSFMWAVYLSFVIIVFIGSKIKKPSFLNVVGASLTSSLLFFLVTNFAVWFQGGYYPMNVGGLFSCYEMAIPFFQNTLLGDLVFISSIFSLYHLAKIQFPVLDKNYISK